MDSALPSSCKQVWSNLLRCFALPVSGRPAFGLALFVAVWTLESFFVQHMTLQPPHSRSVVSFWFEGGARLLLDASCCTALSLLLPGLVLALLQPFTFACALGIVVYSDYFHQALSILTVMHQSGEGLHVADALWPLLQPWHSIFVVTLSLKLYLALQYFPRRRALATGTGARYFALYFGLIGLLNLGFKPFKNIATWETVSGMGVMYGYTPTWLAELAFFDETLLTERALQRAQSSPPSQLIPVEAPIPRRDRVVFVQFESLDYALVDFMIAGRAVTPELNRLRHAGRFYAVNAEKRTGSSDADVVALMGQLPSSDVATYKLAAYPFENSIIKRLHQLGFHTHAIHGVSGEFFNRRPAYARMGFDQFTFREEFARAGTHSLTGWSLGDRELFDYAAQTLRARTGKAFELVITATSHIPFHDLDESLKRFFPGSHDVAENYFDAIAYGDEALGTFVHNLPPETTLVIYGDHSSQVESEPLGYHQLRYHGIGCVPFLIVDTSVNLADSQSDAARNKAQSGEFTLLDAMLFVHHEMLRAR